MRLAVMETWLARALFATLYETKMSILSAMNKPRLFKRGGFNAILDCGHWHNRWLEIALEYLPEEFLQNAKEEILFISTATRDACRVARYYCETREIILISERILPSMNTHYQSDRKARYFIYVILHEVAHAIRKHKSPLFDDLSEEESENQEKEADDLAMKWFNDHVGGLDNLSPITKEDIERAQEEQQRAMKKLMDGI
jgi:hypothetical protein